MQTLEGGDRCKTNIGDIGAADGSSKQTVDACKGPTPSEPDQKAIIPRQYTP